MEIIINDTTFEMDVLPEYQLKWVVSQLIAQGRSHNVSTVVILLACKSWDVTDDDGIASITTENIEGFPEEVLDRVMEKYAEGIF